MSLADIKGEKAFDVIAEIAGPALNIATDDEISGFFQPLKVPKGMTMQTYALKRMHKYFPTLLKKHKQDFIVILAAMNDKTVEEYEAELTVPILFQSIMDLMHDPTFKSFLS